MCYGVLDKVFFPGLFVAGGSCISGLSKLVEPLLYHAGNVVIGLVILLQAQQVLAGIEVLAGCHVDVCHGWR